MLRECPKLRQNCIQIAIMQKFIFIFLFLSFQWAFGQSCPECRYYSYVFDSVAETTVRFGEGVNGQGQSQVLYMDVYQPVGDTASLRPVVIFAFGGGFLQGARTDGYVQNACRRFAKAGYVAAAIDYRIGFDVFGLWPNPVHELMRVFFRAMQDMRGSVQYMRAHADLMGNAWRIDTNRITIGGASAGAITALMVAYCDKDTEFEEMGSLSAIAPLGGFYSTTGDYPNYSWDAMQVMNVAGALVNAEWVEPGDPPHISAHGDQDAVVPYQGGNFDLGFASIGLEGSYLVDQQARAVGVCSYLYTMVGQDHPSGSMSDEELDEIFNRFLPRLGATVRDESFCCGPGLDVRPDGPVGMILGDSLTLQAVPGGPTSGTVLWCGRPCVATAWGDSLVVVPDSAQQFIAVLQDSGCVSTDFVTLLPVVALEEGLTVNPLRVWPNPGNAQLAISGWEPGESVSIQVLDLSGKEMISCVAQAEKAWINTSHLPAGLYVIQVEGRTSSWRGNWVKM
jgi:acetyl esterase/lipase